MTKELVTLIQKAIDGEQLGVDQLVRQVQPRLRAYILRCTLDSNLADDILQETMLQMLKSLKTIKDSTYFWPWLYRISSNKIAGHFRKTSRRNTLQFSAFADHHIESLLEDEDSDVSKKPILDELHTVVLGAMEKLNPVQRSVLSLRCFEDMSYSQIAEAVGCHESTARVHFFRARKMLKSNLKKQGITGQAVLSSLVVFGKFTACQKTLAAGISASSVNFSSGMTAIQTAVTALKAGLFKYSAATAAAVVIVASAHTAWVRTHPHPYPQRKQVQSVHYTVQGVGLLDETDLVVAAKPANRIRKADVDIGPYFSKGAYEMWTQFPEGPDGPVLVRMQRWGLDKKTHENRGKLCGWLQNGSANYYYACGLNRVYITNDPIGMLMLPSDPPKLSKFLIKHSQYQDRIRCSYDRKTGLLKGKVDDRVPTIRNYKSEYAYNGLTDQDFEKFWPEDVGVVDERDTMHRRGWTYFTVEGTYNGLEVSGRGRLPFTYAQYKDHKPWLHLNIGSAIEILDTPKGAVVIYDSARQQRSVYPSETFFSGLGRPWYGIRAFDTTRRDAAKERIPFNYKRKDETGFVSVLKKGGGAVSKIEYQIDMLADVIKSITFYGPKGRVSGQLTFQYVQELQEMLTPPEQPLLPEWVSQEPVLKTSYGLFGLLENIENSGTHLAGR